jgi:dipeptidase D
MAASLSELRPPNLWKHFEAILQIPRCSGRERDLANYIIDRAKTLSLSCKKDRTGNVLVRKPASSGREAAQAIVLQAHLDMVCEKDSEVSHDFSRDPIKAEIREGWVMAGGTTLGSDNGIGVAACLAVMEDGSIVHGPLEFLFTVEEETGLTGARRIEPGLLGGTKLINLDSEEEGTFTIGCAGGADSEISLPISRRASRGTRSYRIKISGLRGGHSGLDIQQGRANAIKLLARVLWQVCRKSPFELIRIEGGSKRNAIPREAWADVLLAPGKEKSFAALLQKVVSNARTEYGSIEKDLVCTFQETARKNDDPMTPHSQAALVDFLFSCPNGVLRMHPEIPGLVETSTNLSIVHSAGRAAQIICNSRSSVAPALEATRSMLRALAEIAGAKIRQPGSYPGWSPNLNSPLLKALQVVHQKVFGKEARVVAVHAGLECGIIGEKFPDLDMISMGPTIQHPHSPGERVEIASVENFWKLLTAALQELS